MPLRIVRHARLLALLAVAALLGGCDFVVLNPAGDIAIQQRNLILASTGLMLLIILPVIAATAIFAWRYRESNTGAPYAPNWSHSTSLEVLIWTAPLLIVIALGALTWVSTHLLDPFRTVARLDSRREVMLGTKPLTIEAVALDWKWLFIYPDYGIATINEIAAPVDMPIQFRLTSGTVMNTLSIPALAGQIYAMAGMQTKLGAVINKVGTYQGFSGNYSGAGFSEMHFKFYGMENKDFDAWVERAKKAEQVLDGKRFQQLSEPSEGVKPQFFGRVDDGIFERIVNLCVDPGKMCLDRMMAIDAVGGVGGEQGEINRAKLTYDGARMQEGNEAPGATFPASGRPPNSDVQPQGERPRAIAPEVNQRATEHDDAQGGSMPGMDMKPNPAPAQINPH